MPVGRKPVKTGQRMKETALRSRETVEFPSPPLFGEEAPASQQEKPNSFASGPEDEPLETFFSWNGML
ncbi:hypothetical protein E2320_002258 [Naja naja]|nr:hypothetical protein E2320_002258 [Naja naja]